jgi:hypothetical protein
MNEENSAQTNKSRKKTFSQPTFTEDELKKAADEFRRRRKYDEGYRRPDFDEWTAAFTVRPTDYDTRALFLEYDLNVNSPYHWRALLEAFIRDYVKYRGRPDQKTPEKIFRFAIDVNDVIRDHSVDERNFSSVATALQKNEPYKTKYAKINPDTLRKSVKEVTNLIGPMGDGALVRLANIDPDRVLDALVDRAGMTEEDLRRWD